jgi:hypothetical protein
MHRAYASRRDPSIKLPEFTLFGHRQNNKAEKGTARERLSTESSQSKVALFVSKKYDSKTKSMS